MRNLVNIMRIIVPLVEEPMHRCHYPPSFSAQEVISKFDPVSWWNNLKKWAK